MKLSLSLSDDVGRSLPMHAQRFASGNASLLADVALRHLLSLPADKISELVARHRLDRRATTRPGWSRAFWLVLGEEMGRTDTIDNPFASRNYGDFYVVMLLNHRDRYDDEGDPFHIHIGPRISNSLSADPFQWTFERTESPVTAAKNVAAKLRQLGVDQEENVGG